MSKENWNLTIEQSGQTQFDEDIKTTVVFSTETEATTVFWSLLKVPYIKEKLKFMDIYQKNKENPILSYSYPDIISCYDHVQDVPKQQIINSNAKIIYDSTWTKQDFRKQMNIAKKNKDKKMLLQIKQKAKEHGLLLSRTRNKKKEEEELELIYKIHQI